MSESSVTASAAKRGRFPHRPYVPLVKHVYAGPPYAVPKKWTQQIKGLAFETREKAIVYAQHYIDANYGKPAGGA